MRKILAFLLVCSMALALCGCTVEIDLSNMGAQWATTPTEEPERIYETPENNDAIKAYLENKYGGEFTHKSYDREQKILYYKSNQYNQLIKVYTRDGLWMDGYDITDFTEPYADNGYFAAKFNEAYKYYWDIFSYIPRMTMVLDFNGEVLPSYITPNIPFETLKKAHPEYFTPTVYLLFEEDIERDKMDNIRAYMEALDEELMVCIVVAPEVSWENATVENIAKFPSTYNIRQTFSTIKNDSGE